MNAPADIPQAMLPVVQRAQLALKSVAREAELVALAQQSAGITTLTNKAGYQECHAARMRLKTARVETEKDGKAAREDAKDFQQAVIAEERRLIAIIEPEERRLEALQDAVDRTAREAKEARERAERERAAKIAQRIDWIRGQVVELAGKSGEEIEAGMATIAGLPLTEELYAERLQEARDAAAGTMAKLAAMVEQAQANAREQARLSEQRRQLEEQQAAQERQAEERRQQQAREDEERRQRLKQEDDARAARQREEDAERERVRAADAAERERVRKVEQARVDGIRERIHAIRLDGTGLARFNDDELRNLAKCHTVAATPQEEFAEFHAEAIAARADVVATIGRELVAREERAAAERAREEAAAKRADLERKADLWSCIEAIAVLVSEATDTAGDPLPDADCGDVVRKITQIIGGTILARDTLAAFDRNDAAVADATEGRR